MASLPFQEEAKRVASFSEWPPSSNVSCLTLARSGFCYCGSGLLVKCWRCDASIDVGAIGEKFKHYHKTASPNCPEINRSTSTNIPLRFLDYNINLRGTTQTDDCSKRSDLQSLADAVSLRATRKGIFETKIRLSLDEPDFDLLRRERVRLLTFQYWPSTNCTRCEDLAEAGFFYSGIGDKVRCAFCRNDLSDWKVADIPRVVHKKYSPDCPFVCENLIICANISRGEDDVEDEIEVTPVSGFYRHDGETKMVVLHSESLSAAGTKLLSGGTGSGVRPKNSQMSSIHEREQSYKRPAAVIPKGQNPKVLAAAGFYYCGPLDLCRCFFCGGGVREWLSEDDPWVEHAKFYPHCGHVKTEKGPEFVQRAQDMIAVPQTSSEAPISLPSHMQSSLSSSSAILQSTDCNSLPVDFDKKCTLSSKAEGSQPEAVTGASNQATGQSAAKNKNKKRKKKKSSGASSKAGVSSSDNVKQSVHQETESFEDSTVHSELVVDSVDDIAILENENRLLNEAHFCKICRQKEVNAVFLPCGHLVACEDCVSDLRICIICRLVIRGTVKTFFK